MEVKRCDWANLNKSMQEYHDSVWGVPVHDDKELFKKLCLDGMQAGLSWNIILSKMDSICKAFDDFAPEIVSRYDDKKIEELLQNPGIIRNRLKVNSVVTNAKAYFALCEKYGSLDDFLWKYVDYKPIVNEWTSIEQLPASTPLSDEISKCLKKMGFKFVGTTIIYAFMQAVGIVNDHLIYCDFR